MSVISSKRDILEFSPTEHERYYVCVVNPSDVNALPGNEWGGFSVESMLGNNTLLRLDQVFLVNQKVLDPSHHQGVSIDPYTLSSRLKDTTERVSSMTIGKR